MGEFGRGQEIYGAVPLFRKEAWTARPGRTFGRRRPSPGKWVYGAGLGAAPEPRAALDDRWGPGVAVNAPRPWDVDIPHRA